MQPPADVLQAWSEQVRAAGRDGRVLRIRGGSSKAFYGDRRAVHCAVLDTRAYAGIIDYDPAELVVTARCGTPVADLESVLAAEGQMLGFEPPHFGATATVGGVVAAGLSGPRRPYVGALRDFVLGATLLDGRGQLLRFGGQVMKNVAGYDVARLLAGSRGALGVIADVSIKLLPRTSSECTLCFQLASAQAIERMNRWAGQPLPLSASLYHDGLLWLRLSGAHAAVGKAVARLGGERIEAGQADAFWRSVREHQHSFFADGVARRRTLWRLALPPTTVLSEADPRSLIEWGGGQRWLYDDTEVPRAVAHAAGGHAVAFRRCNTAIPCFEALSPALGAVHRRIHAVFDPHAVFERDLGAAVEA